MQLSESLVIAEALTPEDYEAAKRLMIEYKETALAEDYAVGGGGLEEELERFPGPYVPPKGLVLLALVDGRPCGCLALRPIPGMKATSGEVVRMYVQPAARGQGIAEALMRTLMRAARDGGYTELFLDSLKRFTAAHRLYEKMGFAYCAPYSFDTTDAMRTHMIFMRRDLD